MIPQERKNRNEERNEIRRNESRNEYGKNEPGFSQEPGADTPVGRMKDDAERNQSNPHSQSHRENPTNRNSGREQRSWDSENQSDAGRHNPTNQSRHQQDENQRNQDPTLDDADRPL